MAADLPDPYVSHTEPEALIPNRLDLERSTAVEDIRANLQRLGLLLEWRTRLTYGETPLITGIE